MSTIQQLIQAEAKALHLFNEVEQRGLIRPGVSEKQLNKEIYALAKALYGIKKYWHKRIVRAGKNTLHPYRENPPDLVLQEDDILFFDFGPVFEDWEADFGRTYVIGHDPLKHKMKADIESAWKECRDWYFQQTSLTGSQFYYHAASVGKRYGWDFGGPIAGHLIGKFPHEKLDPDHKDNYIHPLSHQDMFEPDKSGHQREWILEIHFIDKQKEIGGFFEQLLV